MILLSPSAIKQVLYLFHGGRWRRSHVRSSALDSMCCRLVFKLVSRRLKPRQVCRTSLAGSQWGRRHWRSIHPPCQCNQSKGYIANQVCRYVTLLEASGGDATGAQSTCQEQETLLIHTPPPWRVNKIEGMQGEGIYTQYVVKGTGDKGQPSKRLVLFAQKLSKKYNGRRDKTS